MPSLRPREIACADDEVEQVCIWTPDKDLAQCVRGDRVVQVDRRSSSVRNADGVREKFGVDPAGIPDLLALVGDSADGYPGIAGIGKVTAARLVNRYGSLEEFPPDVLGEQRDLALLFKDLATLRSSAPVLADVDELRWRGPAPGFAAWAERLGDPRLLERSPGGRGPGHGLTPAVPVSRTPRPGVETDRDEQDDAHRDLLVERVEAEQDVAVADEGDEQHADDRRARPRPRRRGCSCRRR